MRKLLERLENSRLVEGINDPYIFKALFTAGGPGSGKCLGFHTPVMLYDGTTIKAGEVKDGDLLMGDDSTPRKVVNVVHESGSMVRVTPVKGDSFDCGENHILVFDAAKRKKIGGVEISMGYETVEMDVKQYLDMSNRFKARAKLIRTGVEFPFQDVPVDPYFLGVWLGDGHGHATALATYDDSLITTPDEEVFEAICEQAEAWDMKVGVIGERGLAKTYSMTTDGKSNPLLDVLRGLGVAQPSGFGNPCKHIPSVYKRNSKGVRLELIAGLIDADGHLSSGCVDFVQKRKVVADDFVWLCRSVGLAAYVSYVNGEGYWRVSVSGDLSIVPNRVHRKMADPRRQVKDVLRTGFTMERIEDGTYCSIETDGNHRHLLGDFTVTHNSYVAKHAVEGMGLKFVNSDVAFERLLKTHKLPLKLADPGTELGQAQQVVRGHAKQLTKGRQSLWTEGMLGLVIDGTGKDFNKITRQAKALRSIGYDVGMIFVNTSLETALKRNAERSRSVNEDMVKQMWNQVQSNMGGFQSWFGNQNFFIVDSNQTFKGADEKAFGTAMRRMGMKWLSKPIKNSIGRDTIDQLKAIGGKTMKDLPRV